MQASDGNRRIPIAVGKMPQQEHCSNPEEDWTGIVDRLERKKLQNRINQRVYRRRKMNGALLSVSSSSSSTSPPVPQPQTVLHYELRSTALIPTTTKSAKIDDFSRIRCPATLCDLDSTTIEKLTAEVESWAYYHSLQGTPRADNLFTLVQFNVFRAMAHNALVLGLGIYWLEEDALSPFNTLGPALMGATILPATLEPSMLQHMVPHHPWLDLLPSPQLRDNLLLAGDRLDECKLCTDILGFSGRSTGPSGLIVWGKSWNPNDWEATEYFSRNWDWALRGCSDIQESTNVWRRKRGLKTLKFEGSVGQGRLKGLL